MIRFTGIGGIYGNYGINAILSSRNHSSLLTGLSGSQSHIKSGSFIPALKAYYGQNTAKNRYSSTALNRQDLYRRASRILKDNDAPSELKDSISVLTADRENSPFEKKTFTRADGTTVTDYDRNAIYDAVNNFVKKYNAAVDDALQYSDRNVQNTVSGMSRITDRLSKSLETIGITHEKSGKLSLSEDAFKSADMDSVKKLLGSSYGLTKSISYSASRLQTAERAALVKDAYGSVYGRGYSGLGYTGLGYSGLGYTGLGNYFNSYF